ncbi:MAG: hypothetical protein A2Y34_13845 [Spirochaetes bacterium GWC1_27_15]|nr:MAG: hypothetical protein A2Z98_06525 [Spirochaetes bacterium GWB1_27_13]OHD27549.1 MAG: hypothetical protein A2Y34_13845 [Spirochaetes bacterium GWC1_27_15]
MATYILNRFKAAKFQLNPHEYNVMIRITSPQEEFIKLETEEQYKDILELRFYDFVQEQNGLMVFGDQHLETILNFFEKHKHCKNMVIHCDYGISRSAGIAVGWLLFNDDRSNIYKIYHDKKHIPNRMIVEKFAKRLNRTMKYIDKWEKEKFEGISQ